MCLNVDKKKTSDAKRRRKPSGFVKRWKVVRVSHDVCSLIFLDHVWSVGINRANLQSRHKPSNYVNEGIHVYVNMNDALEGIGNNPYHRIMEVFCQGKDLIAVGRHSDDDETPQEVYTKVLVKELPK